MIDVSYRYRTADLKGGKMMMDPETGIVTLEGVPVDEHVEMPLPKDFEKSGINKQHDPATGYTTVTGQVVGAKKAKPHVKA